MVTPEAPELTVRAYDYVEGTLSNATPSFELSGAPEDGGYYYGISINGGGVVRLRNNTYAVTKSGEFTLAFYLLNSEDATVDGSGTYRVIVDYTEAEQNSEAWMMSNDMKLYGTLASLLSRAGSGATIYLLTSDVIALASASALDSVTLAADASTFGDGAGVVISDTSVDGTAEEGTTYVWVGYDVAPMMRAMMSSPAAPTFTVDSVAMGGRTLASGDWVNGNQPITLTTTDTVVGNTYTYEISVDNGANLYRLQQRRNTGGLSLSNGTTYDMVFRLTGADNAGNINTLSISLAL